MKKQHTKPVALFRPKAMKIYTADATLLDFGDQIETAEDIDVGMMATIQGGGVPDGEYVMPDGSLFVFEKGVLVKMVLPVLAKARALLKEIRSFRALITGHRSSRFGGFKPKIRF